MKKLIDLDRRVQRALVVADMLVQLGFPSDEVHFLVARNASTGGLAMCTALMRDDEVVFSFLTGEAELADHELLVDGTKVWNAAPWDERHAVYRSVVDSEVNSIQLVWKLVTKGLLPIASRRRGPSL